MAAKQGERTANGEPRIGASVWFWQVERGKLSPRPAMLVEQGLMSGLWAVNVFRPGAMWAAREVPFSNIPADGSWTWPCVEIPDSVKVEKSPEAIATDPIAATKGETASQANIPANAPKRGRGRPKKNASAAAPADASQQTAAEASNSGSAPVIVEDEIPAPPPPEVAPFASSRDSEEAESELASV